MRKLTNDYNFIRKISCQSTFFRFIILFAFFVDNLSAIGQSVFMHEAQEDAEMSEPLSFGNIVYGVILILISFVIFIFANKLKNTSLNKYKKIIKIFLFSYLTILAISFLSVSFYYENKDSKQLNLAYKNFSKLCTEAETYVISNSESPYCLFEEIDVSDFRTPSNLLYTSSLAEKIFGFNNDGKDGVYFCYDINWSPMMEVIFAREANKMLGTLDDPSLYYCYIRPYRIRYFIQNVNPSKDILNAYLNFKNSFIKTHYSRILSDNSLYTLEIMTSLLNNDYYKVCVSNGGDEMWCNNHVMFENDITPERVYEYETVNYGNFEIMYCVTRPSKLRIEEKPLFTPEGKYYNSKLKYERNQVYSTLGKLFCIIFLPVACVFGYGYWGRNKKDENFS